MNTKSTLAVALGSAFIATVTMSPAANAAQNPFAMQTLNNGYMSADASMSKEGKTAEAKCGAEKQAAEAKCGAEKKAAEAKCGAEKKAAEAKCGANKAK